MVLGVPLGSFSITCFFFHDVVNDDVQHIDALLRLGDVQVAFGIVVRCFMQRPYYLPHSFPPFLDFQRHLASFYSTFIRVYGRLLGPSSLECPKASLVCQQSSFPISRGVIGLASMEVIALVAYLES